MSHSLQPLSASNRDRSLDILRGFALAGVLFIFCVSDIGVAKDHSNSLLDEIIAWPKYIFIEGRMYTMLIFIFGIGFHVQLAKAKQSNRSLVPAFTRRLIGLLILGCIHAILLSNRDVLIFYGVAGAVLLLVRNFSSRQLLIVLGITFLALISGSLYLLFGNVWPQIRTLVQPNDYSDHVQYNWNFFLLYHQMYGVYLEMLFHFLLGFWISKAGILKKMNEDKIFRRQLFVIALAITAVLIPIYYFWAPENFPLLMKSLGSDWQKYLLGKTASITWYLLTTACVTLYATTLISISRSVKEKWFRPLTAFGQMTLSNYLIQSFILVPYLLLSNKFNSLPPFEGFIVFLLVFAFQLVFSSWWMTRFTLGPIEWLLRSFTYWKWQSIRNNTKEEWRRIRLTTAAML
jgi:uncharacterized protein